MGIFNFKKNKKDVVVSTKAMTDEEYIKAIERPILDAWSDPVLMEKTGINDLFAENVKVVKEMSEQDILDCIDRIHKMEVDGINVSTRFNQEAADYHKDSFEKRKMAAITGIGSVSNYENDYFSADTILRIMKDVRMEKSGVDVSIPDDRDLLEYLNEQFEALKEVKGLMFNFILISAKSSFAPMLGYKN